MCPHDDKDRCSCRKPAPGLLHEAADDYELDLTRSVMVGDRWATWRRATSGCRTVFIDRGYAERSPVDPDAVANDLAGAANWIIPARLGSGAPQAAAKILLSVMIPWRPWTFPELRVA